MGKEKRQEENDEGKMKEESADGEDIEKEPVGVTQLKKVA